VGPVGRFFNKEEIEQMPKDTDLGKNVLTNRTASKEALEFKCTSIRESITGDLKAMLRESEVYKLQTAVTEALDWLKNNGDASKDTIDEQLTILGDICDPIISNAYLKIFPGSPGSMPGGLGNNNQS
jgi:molecular chaperone DnaK (HSP70)